MNQIDMERNQEEVTLSNIESSKEGTTIGIKNSSPFSVRIVAIWILDLNSHKRCDLNLFLNSGEATNYTLSDIDLLEKYIIKIVTERGNIAVYSTT